MTRDEKIEALIAQGKWGDAQREVKAALRESPDDHWLMARMATTHCERGDYAKALVWADKSLARKGDCPLAAWERAGALDMLGRTAEAAEAYTSLIGRGLKNVAEGDCGEGADWAAGLLADCIYRLSQCYDDLGERGPAARLCETYLRMVDLGASTIYPRDEAVKHLRKMAGRSPRHLISAVIESVLPGLPRRDVVADAKPRGAGVSEGRARTGTG